VVGFHEPRPGVFISLREGVKLFVGLIKLGDVQYFELSFKTVRRSLTSNELDNDDVYPFKEYQFDKRLYK